ncbi:MAG: VCBS repeat-containing protein [Planctomycetota bacterium]
MRSDLLMVFALVVVASVRSSAREFRVQVEVKSPLPAGFVPVDPKLNLGKVVRDAGGIALDPNSMEVFDLSTGESVSFARTEDFAYGDEGRLEWVVKDARHLRYEIRFRDLPTRPALDPRAITPRIGTGDLLRYNAGQTRPIELNCPARLIDLTGDGKADLVGTWNYAYRPGEPWNGIVCFPRVGGSRDFEFGDRVRVRYVTDRVSKEFLHFSHTYMSADFADYSGDGLVDLIYCPSKDDQLHFYTNSGTRDEGGMPVFVASGKTPRQTTNWEHFRAVDLDTDGTIDITLGNLLLRGTGMAEGVPRFAPITSLNVGDARCFLDVDADGQLDAIVLKEVAGSGLSNYSVGWQKNQGGNPPAFSAARPLEEINSQSKHPVDVVAVHDGAHSGLLVTQQHWETMQLFTRDPSGRFKSVDVAKSRSAVLGLGDQAWPCFCDWDDDGDLDLLVGGGYGWPRIVVNDGTQDRPAYRAPQFLYSEGNPIRLTRNEILESDNWHDMGYSYPAFVDWDGDGLSDLVLANETNRIYWYRNIGTRSEPGFGGRQPVLCDGFPDSPESRKRSAALADNPKTPNAPYPQEEGQPFYWRTGPAFADFDDDGLLDIVTADGQTRRATLFTRYFDDKGSVRLRKKGTLKLVDGRPIDHSMIVGSRGWTESYRAVDWDGDGLQDLVYSLAGQPSSGSIQLFKNVGSKKEPLFQVPKPLRAFGEPINITAHGPHPWVGDLDGDGLPDLVACVEWSVYPFYAHNAIEMTERPKWEIQYPK